jgi:hypothetical protein
MKLQRNYLATAIAGVSLVIFGCAKTGMTDQKAMELVSNAGGVSRVSSEANAIFSKYGVSQLGGLSIFDSDITNYPAIATLTSNSASRSFLLVPGTPGNPSQIRILYGPHSRLKCIRIFQSTNDLSSKYRSSLTVALSSNIFFGPIEGIKE